MILTIADMPLANLWYELDPALRDFAPSICRLFGIDCQSTRHVGQLWTLSAIKLAAPTYKSTTWQVVHNKISIETYIRQEKKRRCTIISLVKPLNQ